MPEPPAVQAAAHMPGLLILLGVLGSCFSFSKDFSDIRISTSGISRTRLRDEGIVFFVSLKTSTLVSGVR